MADYPALYPCPQISGYRLAVDMGVLRSSMRGHQDQRREFTSMPTIVACSFVLADTELQGWQDWMSANGCDWFNLPMASMYNKPRGGGDTEPHSVRLISDIDLEALTDTHFKANVEFELSPVNFIEAQ